MVKLFFIYVTGTSSTGKVASGYLNDRANPDQANLKIAVYTDDKFDEMAEELVAFFSRRRAQQLADDLQKKAEQKYPNQKSAFEIREKSVPDRKFQMLLKKPYIFRP